MSLTFAPALMERMGFRPFAAGESLKAQFHCLNVYALRGITVDTETRVLTRGAIDAVEYALALGFSVNELSQALLANDLVDDELAWAEQHTCTAPYALIHIRATPQQSSSVGRIKEDGTELTTYDCFSAAKDELRSLESKVLPALLTSLNCQLSSASRQVSSPYCPETRLKLVRLRQGSNS